ncbi:Uncharacterised protein [Zhongshania aliphaticivorans]|uniref:DUF1294 domain-containing protein n=1 Tax=Zhongshania aliphaticivorans TaxID=1470434 RepID=A0A5S9PY45_9GAMM|nr:DUF1294 domain-containing protein [Zhongshania aliphaticivorans]CAA0092340.1 Uncharacterised protein [Zhongshania aliphaticivorans]CAA0109602.1 Uncharacterised protein [Zhongshania aliphaticivorans]
MAFVAAIFGSYSLGYTPLIIGVLFLVASFVTYFYYAKDKKAAVTGTWRVPENTLHILAICCGWPGALVAQERLRHKTKKLRFRVGLWLTVLVNIAGVVWLHLSQGSSLLQRGLHHVEGLVMSHDQHEFIISTVLLLTTYRL